VKPVLRTASQSLASQQPSAGGGGGSNSRQAKLRTTTASGQPLTSVSVRHRAPEFLTSFLLIPNLVQRSCR
jgi:hypothetical protein